MTIFQMDGKRPLASFVDGVDWTRITPGMYEGLISRVKESDREMFTKTFKEKIPLYINDSDSIRETRKEAKQIRAD
jgi:hypothetical protein